jgi:hypothetical protein
MAETFIRNVDVAQPLVIRVSSGLPLLSMTYWLQQLTDNPIGASVDLVLLAMLAALLLYGFIIVRAWFKKLLEQASFMVPHQVGISASGRSVSPSVYVIELIELESSLVVGYFAMDVQDAERVCKRRWLRRCLRNLVIEDVPAWNGKTKIAAREADASERIRFMNAMQIYNGILLGRTDASGPLQFVLVDRNNRRVVKIGYA